MIRTQQPSYHYSSTAQHTLVQERSISLAQRYAFDVCASYAHSAGDTVLLHAGRTEALAALKMRLEPLSIQILSTHLSTVTTVQTIIWYQPTIVQGSETALALRRVMAQDARLIVIGSGLLQRFSTQRMAGTQASLAMLHTWLAAAGMSVELRYGFHTLQSIAWGFAAQYCERFGQLALADRCQYAMRQSYVTSSPLIHLSPMYILVARLCR